VLPEVTSVPETGKSYGLVTNTCETSQQRIRKYFEFEVLATINMKITEFRDVTPCSSKYVYICMYVCIYTKVKVKVFRYKPEVALGVPRG
jgi:hypothetical protein